MAMYRNSVLIIPSLDPDERLVRYVRKLIASGFSRIILVDDGSSPQSQPVFQALRTMPECDLLVHTVNMGKGRSLKDALNYYCQKYAKGYLGVITADADGQHTPEDVIRLDEALLKYPKALILGARDFDDPSVPWKSRFGNKMTRQVMRFLIGSVRQEEPARHAKAISDTQTGLRAIPNKLIAGYLTLPGERFEYETNMLIEALHVHTPVKEITIRTVYIDENKQTHFRPLADSYAIYRQIFSTFLKYVLASLSSFLIDSGMYSLLIVMLGFLPLAPKIWIAAAAARILSSLYNYAVNKTAVFRARGGRKSTLEKYYTLCILQLCCSAQLVWVLCSRTGFSEIPVKIVVDMLLFFVSFYVQKNWVFREKKCSRGLLEVHGPDGMRHLKQPGLREG